MPGLGLIFKIAFLLTGMFLSFVGLRLLIRYHRLKKKGSQATGVVKEIIASDHFDGLVLYFPILEIITAAGETVRVKSSIGCNQHQYKIGDQVTVLYDPDNPQKAEIKSTSKFQKYSIIILLAGIFFFIAGGVVKAQDTSGGAYQEVKDYLGDTWDGFWTWAHWDDPIGDILTDDDMMNLQNDLIAKETTGMIVSFFNDLLPLMQSALSNADSAFSTKSAIFQCKKSKRERQCCTLLDWYRSLISLKVQTETFEAEFDSVYKAAKKASGGLNVFRANSIKKKAEMEARLKVFKNITRIAEVATSVTSILYKMKEITAGWSSKGLFEVPRGGLAIDVPAKDGVQELFIEGMESGLEELSDQLSLLENEYVKAFGASATANVVGKIGEMRDVVKGCKSLLDVKNIAKSRLVAGFVSDVLIGLISGAVERAHNRTEAIREQYDRVLAMHEINLRDQLAVYKQVKSTVGQIYTSTTNKITQIEQIQDFCDNLVSSYTDRHAACYPAFKNRITGIYDNYHSKMDDLDSEKRTQESILERAVINHDRNFISWLESTSGTYLHLDFNNASARDRIVGLKQKYYGKFLEANPSDLDSLKQAYKTYMNYLDIYESRADHAITVRENIVRSENRKYYQCMMSAIGSCSSASSILPEPIPVSSRDPNARIPGSYEVYYDFLRSFSMNPMPECRYIKCTRDIRLQIRQQLKIMETVRKEWFAQITHAMKHAKEGSPELEEARQLYQKYLKNPGMPHNLAVHAHYDDDPRLRDGEDGLSFECLESDPSSFNLVPTDLTDEINEYNSMIEEIGIEGLSPIVPRGIEHAN